MDTRTSAWLVLSLVLSSALASGQEPGTFDYNSGADVQASQTPHPVGLDCTSQCTSPCMSACGACDTCGACNACNACEPWRLCTQCPDGEGINLYGWLDAGFVGNTSSPASNFNGPYNAVDRANEGMFNQLYLIAEQKLPSDGCHGFGGRVDVIYGEDFFLAQSVGLENHDDGSPHWNPQYYGVAIPQAYVEMGRTDLSVRVGHFYSPIGYEGLPAATNFFYTKSYSYQFAGPFTHWVPLATWAPCDCWELQGGVTNGWDTLDREPEDNVNLLAKVKYTRLWRLDFAGRRNGR